MDTELIFIILFYLSFGAFLCGLLADNKAGNLDFIIFMIIWPFCLISGIGHFVRHITKEVFSLKE